METFFLISFVLAACYMAVLEQIRIIKELLDK